MKRSPIRSRTHHVTDEERLVYQAVELRDPQCMAPVLDEVEHNRWPGCCGGRLTMQHVKPGPGGKRITDEAHLIRLCEWHHLYTGWATSKHGLALQRAYLRDRYPEAW